MDDQAPSPVPTDDRGGMAHLDEDQEEVVLDAETEERSVVELDGVSQEVGR